MKKNIDIEKKYQDIHRELNLRYEVENRESNFNRARSITVGTAFGGVCEILMRADGGRHLWCVMQPVEVIELIHQLSSNVGCNVDLKPRQDFASWRDWRVSEAEKFHLNNHPPFVNDMAVFQKLGAAGYDDEEAKKIMDLIANAKTFVNMNDTEKIVNKESDAQGADAIMIGVNDGLIHNKLLMDENNNIAYMCGGEGGNTTIRNGDGLKKSKNQKKANQK